VLQQGVNIMPPCISSFILFWIAWLTSSSSSRSPDGPLRSSVTSSNLRSPYCWQRSSISVLDVVVPRAAWWATRGPRPGGWWLLALMTVHHQLKGSIHRHTWVQAGDVTEQGLATMKQDVTNEWKTWSLKHVCVRDMLPPLDVIRTNGSVCPLNWLVVLFHCFIVFLLFTISSHLCDAQANADPNVKLLIVTVVVKHND